MTVFSCPIDGERLDEVEGGLVCTAGHAFPVADGIPILLDPEGEPTQHGYWATASESYPAEERQQPVGDEVDEYVRWILRGTCGNLYEGSRIRGYPIPEFPLVGPGRFLELGSNWGRWSIAAARAGFDPVAIDPSLGAIRAARRVARQLDIELEVAVAEARHLPFPDRSFDVVFSYSVLQHLAPDDVAATLRECARVLGDRGLALHQLPNAYGLLSVYRQARRGFRTARGFQVRYWKPADVRAVFERLVGPTTLSPDGFLTLNPHPGTLDDLSLRSRLLVRSSRAVTSLARRVGPLGVFADSLWVRSERVA